MLKYRIQASAVGGRKRYGVRVSDSVCLGEERRGWYAARLPATQSRTTESVSFGNRENLFHWCI